MYQSLARWCYRRRWTVVIVWLVLIAGLNVAGTAVGAAFNGEFTSTGSESDAGFETVEEYFPGAGSAFGGQIVFQSESGVTGDDVAVPMSELFEEVDRIEGVNVVSPYTPFGAEQVSDDGTVAYAQINLDPDIDDTEATAIGEEI
ncbi:MAG: MMPL family transporter, partial [Ilumatobacter sp.]